MPVLLSFASDHAGWQYKQQLMAFFFQKYAVQDFGTHSGASCDYPDFAHLLASFINEKNKPQEQGGFYGVLICGSANGVAMTANKYPYVRAAVAWQEELAVLARKHNDANVLCIPARFVSIALAQQMLQSFLQTPFEGGRHLIRVRKIAPIPAL